MPSESIAQQNFFKLVNAYKSGAIPKSQVSKSVVETAKSLTKKEIEDYLKVKKNAPEKLKPSKRNGGMMELPDYEELLAHYLSMPRSKMYKKI